MHIHIFNLTYSLENLSLHDFMIAILKFSNKLKGYKQLLGVSLL